MIYALTNPVFPSHFLRGFRVPGPARAGSGPVSGFVVGRSLPDTALLLPLNSQRLCLIQDHCRRYYIPRVPTNSL